MRILLLIVAVVMLAGFKEPESCERFYKKGTISYITIFPICGDSSLYIVRIFSNRRSHETVYKNKKKYSSINLQFAPENDEKRSLWDNTQFEEFYQDGICTEMRSYDQPKKIGIGKTFLIDTVLFFEVNYYPNGFIKNYNLIKEACPVSNGAELDSMNTFIWRGQYDDNNTSIISWSVDTTLHERRPVVERRCGKRIGTWTKTDFSGKVLERINYADSAENKMQKK